jgi:hypothetical protein
MPVSGSGQRTVNLTGLQNHSVFLVTVNTGGTAVPVESSSHVVSYTGGNAVSETVSAAAQSTGAALAGLTGSVSGVFTGNDGQTIVRYDDNEKNQEIFDAIRQGKLRPPASPDDSGILRNVNAAIGQAVEYTVGTSSKQFWAQGAGEGFKQFTALLRATGTHSNVWVAEGNYEDSDSHENKITSAQATALAQKFDIIYQKETPVFGYEYGADETSPVGGMDGDTKIQILVYDIYEDYAPNSTSGVFGYFFSGDELSEATLAGQNPKYKTNEAEIFYVDAYFTEKAPDAMYSTLAHEFQHMINFNQKTIKSNYHSAAGVWYNEMLSMLAEDLIDTFIGIHTSNSGHPVKSRIPDFLAYYNFDDPTAWKNDNNVLHYYANAYALGAYLVRNFGGAELVKQIMSNTEVDIASLNSALNSDANPLRTSGVSTFAAALGRYGEAMLFNQSSGSRPSDVLSFNNTVTKTIDGTNYEFSGFDVQALGSLKVWNTNKAYSLKPRTMLLQSNSGWLNKTGGLTITLQPPTASGTKLYIIVR